MDISMNPKRKNALETTEILLDNETSEIVSPRLFGTNIEHTRSCIFQGLSAQLLRNRKFAARPTENTGSAREWYRIGDTALLVPDKPYTCHHEYYHMRRKDECNSQRVVNAYDGTVCGLGQHELFIQKNVCYHFRMIVKTSQPVDVSVTQIL